VDRSAFYQPKDFTHTYANQRIDLVGREPMGFSVASTTKEFSYCSVASPHKDRFVRPAFDPDFSGYHKKDERLKTWAYNGSHRQELS
jgi:hypothetical protein